MEKKFKIGKCFDDSQQPEGCQQVTDETETYGAWGFSAHYITKEDIEHILNGGIIQIDDGEYEHYIKLKR